MVVSGGGRTYFNGYTNSMQFRFADSWSTLSTVAPNLTPSSSLKTALAWHCMAQMDSVTIVVTGGYVDSFLTYTKKSNFYNLATNTWSDLAPDLLIPRAEHGCSFIVGEDGKPTAIVAGGETDPSTTTGIREQNTVEIYNRGLNIWESGPVMPNRLNGLMVIICTSPRKERKIKLL